MERQPGLPAGTCLGPPHLKHFAHLSFPCHDLDEARRFYVEVMGAKVVAEVPQYVAVELAGIRIGLGTGGCSFIQRRSEYPHMAFYLSADEMLQMRQWLATCGIPVTELWTRTGVEGLCFLRDPSANLIELFCKNDLPGADRFPRGEAT
jgi:catechol 2,3-dioxygenase-like lactoylglutathione lyase family enzyme